MARKYVQSQAELAVELGISRRTLSDLVKLPGFPRKGRKGYSVAAAKRCAYFGMPPLIR